MRRSLPSLPALGGDTVATFKPVTARYLRMVLRELELTSAYDHAVWGAKDVYVFDTRGCGR